MFLSGLDDRGALVGSAEFGDSSLAYAAQSDGLGTVVAFTNPTSQTFVVRVFPHGLIYSNGLLPDDPFDFAVAISPDWTLFVATLLFLEGEPTLRVWHLGPDLLPLAPPVLFPTTASAIGLAVVPAPDGWVLAWSEGTSEGSASLHVAHLNPDGIALEADHIVPDVAAQSFGLVWGDDSAYLAYTTRQDTRFALEVARLPWRP